LTSEDRAVIAAGLRQDLSYRQIGDLIGRDKSVVCKEVARNRGPDGSYRGPVAHRVAHERRRRPKPFRLVENPGLCRRIEEWMDQGWSPRLIARVLKEESPRVIMGRVSHETIYQALFVQAAASRKDRYQQAVDQALLPQALPAPSGRAVPTGRRSRSANARPRSPTGRCPATGRATW
jgi:IS30 family transposase